MAALVLLLAHSFAHPARTDVHVPDELQPWVGWVLQDKEYLDCPFLFDQRHSDPDSFICAWPGELELEVTAANGHFSQTWSVYASEQWLPLPGDSSYWPEQVTVNGQAVEVLMRGVTPGVRLAPGRYTIAGRFAWEDRPRTLAIPAASGLLALIVDGRRIARPERNQASVWLAEQETERQAEDALDVQVYRLVADDVPTRLSTVWKIEVSGRVREELFAPVLPPGFVPLALDSALPARLEADGKLRLQVRPGSWEVRIQARAREVLNEVTLPPPGDNLPAAEIWSYRSNDRLRVTVPEGLSPVDPRQVSAPGEWQELPAFRIEAQQSLAIAERSRGMVAADNQLRLDRTMWLDFAGGGFVFSDSITGSMRSDWRLDMLAPYALLSATVNGADLLVTEGPEAGLTGVELRRSDVRLNASGRSETRGTLPASGWLTRFDSISATVNLPPGQKLLAAIGADRAPDSWVERWKLLDFFLILIVTIATARLFGREAGAIAFLALALSWHESDAPQWIWLNLLAAVALVRVAPHGRLRSSAVVYRTLSFALLIVMLVPFFADQLRVAIYPQLEPQDRAASADFDQFGAAPQAPAPADMAVKGREPMLQRAAESAARIEEVVVTGARSESRFERYAPNAVIQTGPGRPSWRWNASSLSWSGPVDAERTLHLLIMPRWLVTALRFVAVLLLLALAAVFAFEVANRRWQWPPRLPAANASAACPSIVIGSVLAAGTLFASADARAETPSPDILQQLEQRLLEPPPCAPRCAEIAVARVAAQGDEMTIELEVHALENVAVPLPGSLQGWRPESVQVNGAVTDVYRRADQTLWVRTSEGRHRITLQGPLPPVDTLDVPFPATPRVITVRSDGWSVSGIRERRLLSGSLQLARLQAEGATDTPVRWGSDRFPVFVRIERTIELDLEWRVSTQVIRVAPAQGALSVNVPLLDGESILTEDFDVTDGEVLVSLGPTQRVAEWQSTLSRKSPLTLRAGNTAAWKEVWRFAVGNIWHATFSGVPESEPKSQPDAIRIAEFYPRGGETMTLEAERPEATSGSTLAFDNVSLQTDVGARSRTARMTLNYRSTRGAQHVIRLPAGAEVLSVSIDGRNEPLRADEGELSIPILPGEHVVELRWRHAIEMDASTATPAVDLGAAASNIELRLELPQNRWVIATSGPRLGPAVMYWSQLAVLLLIAVILGRIGLTPLRPRHWLLLGLGFSTFSWAALMLVAAWLLVIGARARRWPVIRSWWRFDAVQVLVALLTLAALAAIVVTVPAGLLGTPDMHIVGNGSWGNTLRWFADRSDGLLPGATVVSLPMWMYKALILAWALWFSFALLRWLPWVWQSFIREGLWRSRRGPASTTAEGGVTT